MAETVDTTVASRPMTKFVRRIVDNMGRRESEGEFNSAALLFKRGRVDWDRKLRLFWTSCVLELRCSAVFGLFAPLTIQPALLLVTVIVFRLLNSIMRTIKPGLELDYILF